MGKPNFHSNYHFYCLLVKDYFTQEADKGGSYKESFKIIFRIFKFPCYYFTDAPLITNGTEKIFSNRVYIHLLLYYLFFLNQFLIILLLFVFTCPYQGIFARGTLAVKFIFNQKDTLLHCKTSALILIDTWTVCDRYYNFCCDGPHERSHRTQETAHREQVVTKQITGKKTNHRSWPIINVPMKYNVHNHEMIPVPSHSIIPGPLLRPFPTTSAGHPPLSHTPSFLTPLRPTLDYSTALSSHPMSPHLTIRQPILPSDATQYNKTPLQLSSTLHPPNKKCWFSPLITPHNHIVCKGTR